MANNARKTERRAEREAWCKQQDEERQRVDGLPLWERIDEAIADESLKDVLRLICERAGIDIYQ
ncbi:hypothetical protein [Rhizobium rhizogenes]|uniref:hypothetical protein n=1 Tax=Rhizobium rhizogenes TaxID=359 RepID=UPI0004D35E19|nr:hypothetical protein [Rhizobium rhizogenes]KEA07520.1 hypothetical protein CN09_11540 [Rhizobium rhizogenes]NTJ22196.1 hypothetical protein [Rhizobium rhizogenes]QUE80915.1 hypothetical protein EML492_03650 [Rhizobium rhizogenes]TQO80978.1 hypothetical protein FFE80_07750 [Rhizobium rhizogenes]TRB51572.1 hypothetical protein EXN69_26635 [Rhizobium rhizogenes]